MIHPFKMYDSDRVVVLRPDDPERAIATKGAEGGPFEFIGFQGASECYVLSDAGTLVGPVREGDVLVPHKRFLAAAHAQGPSAGPRA